VASVTMDTIVSLCKRRGFIFQASEIYGGQGGSWDYGPLGVELKNNIKRAWWRAMVLERDDIVGLDSAIIQSPRAWEASGHISHFTDPMVDCRNCKHRFRADHLALAYVITTQGEIEVDVGKTSTATGLVIYPQNSLSVRGIRLTPKFTFSDYRDLVQQVTLESAELNQVLNGNADFPFGLPKGTGYFDFDLGSLQVPSKSILTLIFRGGSAPLRINVAGSAVNLESPNTCPDCGAKSSFTEARQFNLMFKTFVGPVEETAATVYLRPETAQGIFVNFGNVLTATRRKLPFGIAQVGKSFRNEITPGNFTFRSREFEQMEMEFFVRPGADEDWYRTWIQVRRDWYVRLGMDPSHLTLREHAKDELSHYSKGTTDIEYLFPMGWSELEGIANRTDYDLKQHSEFSGERLTYFDEETNEHLVPYVIEPAAGVDRAMLAFLIDAYREEEVPSAGSGQGPAANPSTGRSTLRVSGRSGSEEPSGSMNSMSSGRAAAETRVVLKLHNDLAPVKVAVLPLSRNERLTPTAQEVYGLLRKGLRDCLVQYDDAQSIGRRYRRQDEIGTPYCVTVDFDSLDDRAVTIRDRDSMAQERVSIAELSAALRDRLGLLG